MSLQFQVEAAITSGLLWVLGRLSPVAASNLGGAVARFIGPKLPVSRLADANLRLALPALNAAERRDTIRGVWDNLGRTVGEMPHISRLTIEIIGAEIGNAVASSGRPTIAISAHFGNWEILPRVAAEFGVALGTFYRPASNPLVDLVIQAMRQKAVPQAQHFAKGAKGAREGTAMLRAGGVVGMLIDQKLNDGIAVPFFGHDAMTTRAPASLALHFNADLIGIRTERAGPARLRVTIETIAKPPPTGHRDADVRALTGALNARLETWIRARPQDWLWLHRRWPKEEL
jgi:KDO2-lipid IV(A) lauroyltransferase